MYQSYIQLDLAAVSNTTGELEYTSPTIQLTRPISLLGYALDAVYLDSGLQKNFSRISGRIQLYDKSPGIDFAGGILTPLAGVTYEDNKSGFFRVPLFFGHFDVSPINLSKFNLALWANDANSIGKRAILTFNLFTDNELNGVGQG